jgi:hypothetical protein
MPVLLPASPSQEDRPLPPIPWRWALLLVVFMAVGASATLLTWPKGEPTATAWFWLCSAVFPALTWLLALGLRLHYADDENTRLDAVASQYERDCAKAVAFASEPLAVLASAYVCALGKTGVAATLANKPSVPKPKKASANTLAVRFSPLDGFTGHTLQARAQQCFAALLARMQPALSILPKKLPLEIYLQCPDDAASEVLRDTCHSCLADAELHGATVSLWPATQGLMLLDQWLDQCKAVDLKKFVLVVAIQLHAAPMPDSAEVAVALLLGWPPLAEHHGLKTCARLHRPIGVSTTPAADDLEMSLRWGGVAPGDVHDMWHTHLKESDKSAILQCADKIKLDLSVNGAYSGIHDIHRTLGDPGAAAAWFAAALACEHAAATGAAQWLACHETHLHLAVARPAA